MYMNDLRSGRQRLRRPWAWMLLTCVASVALFLGLLSLAATQSVAARASSLAEPLAPAAPIPPPEGYPKLSLSTKTVTPSLTHTGGATLTYNIAIRNTGATTATSVMLADPLPANATYNGDAWASHGQAPALVSSTLVWTGEVGFDSTVLVTFSVRVDTAFSGTLANTAVISDADIAAPVTVTAETIVTNDPILMIEKTSSPDKPGPGNPLLYELQVSNWGQPMVDQPITVTDRVPFSTTIHSVGPDGVEDGGQVVWTRQLSLALGESAFFTFSVDMDAGVVSGTVIDNAHYTVTAPFDVVPGEPYSVTIVDPILLLSKSVWPDPPGSNREMTYTLTLVNVGSLATGLLISDLIPAGVSYERGGETLDMGVVSWALDRLDTGESATFDYTVNVSDVKDVPIVNQLYGVCSDEGVCVSGRMMTHTVQGPVFETFAEVIPIAKKTGNEPMTPTLGVRNVGNGNALDASIMLTFYRTKLDDGLIVAYLPDGTEVPLLRGPNCGSNFCRTFSWNGNIAHSELVTFSTPNGIGTIGGEDFLKYIATINVTDTLSGGATSAATAQDFGYIMHAASVRAYKSALPVVGQGQLLTYTILVRNHGYATQAPPPVLSDVLPLHTTFVWASDGGVSRALTGTVQATVVSWTLPILSTGEEVVRTFSVRVDEDAISGTQIINDNYRVYGYGNASPDTLIFPGSPPVTTTVKEVGLIDSFKTVEPKLSLPGPDVVLTYVVHLVNSGPLTLTNVMAHDLLPWADSTYQRDAVASAGQLFSDIVSLDWEGTIGPFSQVLVTATSLVDADFEGVLTNTVVISQSDLLSPVVRFDEAFITSQPVLFIHKSATPDPVNVDGLLTYRLNVTNLGQQATGLVITDLLPLNVTYVPTATTGGGILVSNTVQWEMSALEPGARADFEFQVRVKEGAQVVNALYGVRSAEGVIAMGEEVITSVVKEAGGELYLPLVLKAAP